MLDNGALVPLNLSSDALRELLHVDAAAGRAEAADIEQHFTRFGDRLPQALRNELDALRNRL